MATQKVLLKGPAKRRAVLDARRRVLDAEAALQEMEAGEEGMSEDNMEGGASGGGATHIHIHGGKADKPVNSTDEEETGEEQKGENDRMGKMETMLATVGEGLAALTETVRGMMSGSSTGDGEEEDDDKKKTEDGEEEDEDKKKTDDEETEKKDKEDDKSKTTDSAALATSYAQVLAQAEILVPGFRMPTFDAKLKRAATVDAMCSARRKALGLACATADGNALVVAIAGSVNPDIDKMGCKDVATLFKAAAGAKALLNNRAGTKDSGSAANAAASQQVGVARQTLSDINKANQEYWARQAAAVK